MCGPICRHPHRRARMLSHQRLQIKVYNNSPDSRVLVMPTHQSNANQSVIRTNLCYRSPIWTDPQQWRARQTDLRLTSNIPTDPCYRLAMRTDDPTYRPSLTSGQAADRPAQGRPRPPPFPPARFRPVPQPPPLPSQQATRPLPAVPYGQPVRPAPVPPTSGPPPPQTTSRPPPLLQTPSRPPPLPKKPPPPLLSSSFPRIVSETETIISDNNSNFSVTEDNNPPQNISNSPYKPLWPGLPPTPLFGGSADDDVIMSADGVGAILATEELAKCTLLNTGKNPPFWTDFKLLNLHC